MTVKELIAALQALPPEAQDYPVYRYASEWEVESVDIDWKYEDGNPGNLSKSNQVYFVDLT